MGTLQADAAAALQNSGIARARSSTGQAPGAADSLNARAIAISIQHLADVMANRPYTKSFESSLPEVGDNKMLEAPAAVLTLASVRAFTDTGTCTIQLEERTSLHSAGTELLTAGLVADVTGETTSAFADVSVAVGNWLVYTVTAVSGNPGLVWATITGTLATT